MITYERILRQSPVDNRRHWQFRQRRAQEVPGLGHPRDPHLLARREEAGRHAPPPPGAVSGAGRQGEVLHRQRAQQDVRGRGDARSGLCVRCSRAQTGPLMRVLPDGGHPH